MKTALGIDFGGTFVKVGLVNEKGLLLKKFQFSTKSANTLDKWIMKIDEILGEIKNEKDQLAGIGVGVPGFTDFQRGFVYGLPNVKGWRNIPLAKLLKQKFNLPIYVDNDANAMAAGEYRFGAGKGLKYAIFVTLGTGVGGALLVDGKIYRGAYSMAGEIGHIPITFEGIKTPEGIAGLETFVGNQRIVERVLKEIKKGRKTSITQLINGKLNQITPKVIAEAAKAGDKLAIETFDFMAECLAIAFAGLIYTLQPEAIIIGGGMAESGQVLFSPFKKHLKMRLSSLFYKRVKILKAKLGTDAGIIGSASLVFYEKTSMN